MKKYTAVGLGSALLDLTYNVDESILKDLGLIKGQMILIDKDQSKTILNKLKHLDSKISPGGSSANTISGINSLGGKSVFFGKIGNDLHGELYEKKTLEEGVLAQLSKHDSELTGHAITLITPDFERTFATHLGASIFFDHEDIIEDLIKDSKILHLEGYQLENKKLRDSVMKAIKIAKENNLLISLDLSDSGLVKRNLDFLKDFIKDNINIIFANENEAEAFTGKNPKNALFEISKLCDIAIVKLGEKGSLIKKHEEIYEIPPFEVKVVNTNGAGDAYAAGFLYGLSKNLSLDNAGKIASYISSLVVAKESARLEDAKKKELIEFLKEKSFIK